MKNQLYTKIFGSIGLVGLLLIFPAVLLAQDSTPTLSFNPSTVQTTVGEEFTTELVINTAGNAVGGVGAKIQYNTAAIEVVSIETKPVFPDYPTTIFDNTTGLLTVSGIVQSPGESFTGNQAFANITWRLKSAQNNIIRYEYEAGSTRDSNIAVTYGNGDILAQVGELSVSTSGGGEYVEPNTITATITSDTSISANQESTSTTSSPQNIFQQIGSAIATTLGVKPPEPAQESSSFTTSAQEPQPKVLGLVAIALGIVAVLGGVGGYLLLKRPRRSQTPSSTIPKTQSPFTPLDPMNPPLS